MGTHCIYRWKGHQQDVVEQMLVGLGWRITGYCDAADTRTVAITSRDAAGVRFIITAHKDRVGDGWCCVGGTSVDICHKQEVHIDIKTCVSKTHSYSTISISLILCMYIDNIYIYISIMHCLTMCSGMWSYFFPWPCDLRPFQELKMGDFAKEPPAKRQKSTQEIRKPVGIGKSEVVP